MSSDQDNDSRQPGRSCSSFLVRMTTETIFPYFGNELTTRAFRTLHGLPAHTDHSGRSWVTTERAPTTVPRPILTPGAINTSAAIQHSGPMWMGAQVNGI